MTVEKQGYLMTMTLPEILVFNQLSGGIFGFFLPKRIPRAARFHSCLLQSQAVRGLSQLRGLLWDMEHVKKTPLGFLGALLSGRNIWGFDAWFKPISQGSNVNPCAPGGCTAVETSDYFWNLTFPEVQGFSGSSCTERKQGSLHRGILFEFIVNVLNPICYSPNNLNATSLAFSCRQNFVRKFWLPLLIGTKHLWPPVKEMCSLCQPEVQFMALHGRDSKI